MPSNKLLLSLLLETFLFEQQLFDVHVQDPFPPWRQLQDGPHVQF
jgi:hypothetical protein